MDVLAECECHVWVLRLAGVFGYGKCGRCRTRPRIIGVPKDTSQATLCFHEGACMP